MRTMFLTTTLTLGLFAGGCMNAADAQRKADEAQAKADEEVTNAIHEAAKKTAHAEEIIAEATRTSGEKAAEAQAHADVAIANAQASFGALRESYRHDVTAKLVDVDREIDLMAADAGKAQAGAKRTLEAKLAALRTRRAQVDDELRRLEGAAADTWDATKTRLDAELNELEMALNHAD